MDESIAVVSKYVSKKISKVRWRPTSKHIVQTPTIFAAGSWDDEINELMIWHVEYNAASGLMEDDSVTPTVDCEPVQLGSVEHKGDVLDLLFLEQDNIVTASSLGSVNVFKYDQRSQSVRAHHTFERVHHYNSSDAGGSPCTAIASRGDERLASVGEDGRVNLLALDTVRSASCKLRSIDAADSCTLNAVCFLTQYEVAAVNSVGQFKIWDTRQQHDDPVKVFVLTGDRIPLHCMDRHPTQPHIVATGGQDGVLYLWDMRQEKFPITLLEAHSSDMWEVRFHQTNPNHLFTCANDGSLWHWDSSDVGSYNGSGAASQTGANRGAVTDMANNPWLMGNASKRHLAVKELLVGNTHAVNSLDVVGGNLVCGTDGEQINIVRGLSIC